MGGGRMSGSGVWPSALRLRLEEGEGEKENLGGRKGSFLILADGFSHPHIGGA
jgi:hypothetical protein